MGDVSLEPFTEGGECPKCWGRDVTFIYHKNSHEHICALQRELFEPECCTTEHLCRYCRRCSFRWAQAIAGAEREDGDA